MPINSIFAKHKMLPKHLSLKDGRKEELTRFD